MYYTLHVIHNMGVSDGVGKINVEKAPRQTSGCTETATSPKTHHDTRDRGIRD